MVYILLGLRFAQVKKPEFLVLCTGMNGIGLEVQTPKQIWLLRFQDVQGCNLYQPRLIKLFTLYGL